MHFFPLLSPTDRLFHTAYLGTVNSTKETRARSKTLAQSVSQEIYVYVCVCVCICFVCLFVCLFCFILFCFFLNIAMQMNSYHLDLDIDTIVTAVTALFTLATGIVLMFKVG